MNDGVFDYGWRARRPVGLSATAVYQHKWYGTGPADTPADAGDFGRCVDYLGTLRPVWMRNVSPLWRLLVDHWGELLDLYRGSPTTGALTERLRELADEARAGGGNGRMDESTVGQSAGEPTGHGTGREAGEDDEQRGLDELRGAVTEAMYRLTLAVNDACPSHHAPVQHRDGLLPWCPHCGRTALGERMKVIER